MSDEPGADWFERALRQLSDQVVTDEATEATHDQRHEPGGTARVDTDGVDDRPASSDTSDPLDASVTSDAADAPETGDTADVADVPGAEDVGTDTQREPIPEDDPFGGVRHKPYQSRDVGLDSFDEEEADSVMRNDDDDAGDSFSESSLESGLPSDGSPEPGSLSSGGFGNAMSGDALPDDPPTENAADPFGGSQKGSPDASGTPESRDPSGTPGSRDPFDEAGDEFGFAEFGGAGQDSGRNVSSGNPGAPDESTQFDEYIRDSGDPLGGAGGPAGSGSSPPGFDPDNESFDSAIDRIDIGIAGLDEMILGGVPRSALMSIVGSAGTGKTTFALQFLNEAVVNGGKAVYLTLEESREAILETATEKGWPFREYVADDRLAIVALDPIEMASSLASIRNDLSRLISTFGADRLVLDSVSLLEMMYDHPAKRRSEVFEFTRSLKQAGVTTLLTSEASTEDPYTSRYGIVEYLTDAVFILQYVRSTDYQETRLGIEILKIRDANHSRETKPYEITNEGISVYRQANIF